MTSSPHPQPPTLTLSLQCHCTTFTHTISFPLPSSGRLKSSICHCTSCRLSTGHPFHTSLVIPLPMSQVPSCTLPSEVMAGMRVFDRGSGLRRWWCGECGARCWNEDRTGREEWEVSVGVVKGVGFGQEAGGERGKGQRGLDGLLDRVQLWVGDTGDGGAGWWVNRGRLEGMDRRLEGRESPVVIDEMLMGMVRQARMGGKGEGTRGDELEIKVGCVCKAVDLVVTRPSVATRYAAGVDACDVCRQVTGSEITGWVAVPRSAVLMTSPASDRETALDLSASCFGTYRSSEKVMRVFCSTCGANVFWIHDERDTVEIGVGLLGDRNGMRAEGWLNWNKYGEDWVAYRGDAIDEDFVEGLAEGVKQDRDSRLVM